MIRRIGKGHRKAALGGIALIGMLVGGIFVTVAGADDPPTSVGGVTYRHNVVGVTPPGRFTIDVRCPSGTHVSGGGSYSESGVEGAVQVSAPADGPDADRLPDDLWQGRHFFSATESPQGLNANVICLSGGVTYVSRAIAVPPGQAGTVTASCGSARHVAGGGAALALTGAGGYVNSSYPWDGPDAGTVPDDGWTARAFNGTGSDRRLRVTAMCVTTPAAYVKEGQPVAPGSAGFVRSTCPATRHLVGQGARLSGRAKDAVLVGMIDEDGSDLDFAPDDSVNTGGRVSVGSPTSLTVTSFSICR